MNKQFNIRNQNSVGFKTLGEKKYSTLNLSVVLLIMMAIVVPAAVFAQTGTITGQVFDAETGESLPGATVMIKETNYGAATDVDGRYTVRRVPVGDQVLVVRYIGYHPQEFNLTIEDGESVEQNATLNIDQVEGEDLIIVAQQRGQARALTMQRQSVNIKSVMSSEQLDRMTTTNVSDALSRMAGMHGGTNIRGVGSGMSNVTIDGQRMGTTGDNRSVDLSSISSDMVRDLEVIKVITPDMDADALAGVINVSTRRPIGGNRDINVRLGGGSIPRYQDVVGSSARASFSFGDSPRDNFSYALNFSYQRTPSVSESINHSWTIRNFGDGPVDLLSGLTTTLQFNPRERYGTGAQLTFQPTDRTTFHVQGMFNIMTGESTRYGKNYNPTARGWVTQDSTTLSSPTCISCSGSVSYNAQMEPSTTNQYTFRAGGRHLFDSFDMDYNLGWGHSRAFGERYGFNFSSGGHNFKTNTDDRHHPTYSVLTHPNTLFPRSRDFDLSSVDNRWDEDYDNELSATIDFNVPATLGSFKFGASSRMTLKDGNSERYDMQFRNPARLSNLDVIGDGWTIMDRPHATYNIPWLMDLDAGREFYKSQYPNMRLDEETWAHHRETQTYYAKEHTSALYGMTTLTYDWIKFLGGLRFEYADNTYTGRDGETDIGGRFLGATDTTAVNRNAFLFPNAQFVFSLSNLTSVRIAYSRSIGRPSFTQLSPTRMLHHYFTRITRGNPELNPMTSNNFDFIFEHYFMNVGEFTVGLFYKDLNDFVYRATRFINADYVGAEAAYQGWDDVTYFNGDEATVYGAEVSWQQSLEFLPGFLSNLSTFANYTHTRSVTEIDERPEKVSMTGQRPHMVNSGLDYNQGGFSASVFFSWSTPQLNSYGDPRPVPEIPYINQGQVVYFDGYSDGRRNLSAALRYRISNNFRIWLDANNLLAEQVANYNYDREYYPSSIRYFTRNFSLGIRYNL
ncbi:MAG: TonB-dependent receptor [Balneolales bacterium]